MTSLQLTEWDIQILEDLIRETPNKLDAAIRGVGQEIANEIRLSIHEQTPGFPQVRYQPRRTVNVSPDGAPPNTDTGALAGSIRMNAQDTPPMVVEVEDGVEYGEFLELVWNRPFFSPVLARWEQGEFVQFLKDVDILGGIDF